METYFKRRGGQRPEMGVRCALKAWKEVQCDWSIESQGKSDISQAGRGDRGQILRLRISGECCNNLGEIKWYHKLEW